MKSDRWLSSCGIVFSAMLLASCTHAQMQQAMGITPCPSGSGPLSAAPEFCLYATEMHVVNHDTEAGVSLTIANRTTRRVYLTISEQNRPYLTDSDGTKWQYESHTGISIGSRPPLSLEPDVNSQIAISFKRVGSGRAPADLAFTMRGELVVLKTDSRGELMPGGYHPQAVRGFAFSGLRQGQQGPAVAPTQQKSSIGPVQPDSQIAQTTDQVVQAGS